MCLFAYCYKTGRANPPPEISQSFKLGRRRSLPSLFCFDVPLHTEHGPPLNRVPVCLNSPIIPGASGTL